MWDSSGSAEKGVRADTTDQRYHQAPGTDVFLRIKIGVGEKPKGYDLADYVLGHFSREEREMMEEGYQKAAEAVEMILAGELDEAMNVFNRKAKLRRP